MLNNDCPQMANPADGVQDNSLLICKIHKFSLQAEAAPSQTFSGGLKPFDRPGLVTRLLGVA